MRKMAAMKLLSSVLLIAAMAAMASCSTPNGAPS